MPRYHFHTQDGHRFTDDEGVELESLAAAQRYGLRHAAEVLRDDAGEFWRSRSFMLTATDDAGLVLFSIDVSATESPAAETVRPT